MKKSFLAHKKIFIAIAAFFALILIFVIITNIFIVSNAEKKLVSDEELKKFDADCVLILGAGVWKGDVPSPILTDRLNEGLRLYNEGVSEKILVSGDHGRTEYDEVNVMKKYLKDRGVPSENIFMDHAGFSTYESIYRAKEIFGVKKMIVVTQKYHISRAIYICEKLGIEVLGSNSDPRAYSGALYRNLREVVAREKDIFACLFNVKPTYLGEAIDIHGNGNVTNDK